MLWVLLILSVLLLLFLLIIFSKLTILLNYYHFNDDDDLKVEFRLWFGLIKYKIDVPLIKIDDNSPSIVVKRNKKKEKDQADNVAVNQIDKDDVMTSFQNTKELLEHVFGLHTIVRKFFNKVSIKKFEWHTMVGVGDAAYTGMISGGIWALKGSMVGLLSHYLSMKQMPELSVTPHFQAAVIQTRFTGIFQFRIGHAILAGLKLIKFWKGGKPHLKKKAKFANEKTNSV